MNQLQQLVKDQGLIKRSSLIGGEWLETNAETYGSASTFTVTNPFDGQMLTQVFDAVNVNVNTGAAEKSEANEKNDVSQVHKAIVIAKTAQVKWAAKTAYERYDIMMRWFELVIEHKEDLAVIMTLEQGKPLSESRGEIDYGASYIKWFAEEGKRIYGETIPPLNSNQSIKVSKQPVGVVGLVTPWNFPSSMLARKIAPALAAGNSVVARPTELTPLSALALGELACRAGIPAGVINIIASEHSQIVGEVLSTHKDIAKFSFTGSTRVGKLLMSQASSTLKKLSLELGGNAPFIVFDDADIDAAVAGVVKAKFRNSGQTCVCVNRILVDETIHDEFVNKLVIATKQLTVGNGLADFDIGPLIHHDAANDVRQLMMSAIKEGATLVFGEPTDSNLQGPLILTNVNNQMAVAQTEIFGPLVGIQSFKAEEQAIELANDTEYGLASYFYSLDIRRIERVAPQLQFGMVGINESIISNAAAPFGGVKQSGFGREGSRHGLDEYLNIKYLCYSY
jgi:succinate-semialdehyde dehydrogenase / glutarate-semialdehyde dehydrogenase